MKLKIMYGLIAAMVTLALCVSVSLIMPAVLSAKKTPLDAGIESNLLMVAGICLAILLTLGSGTVGAATHIAPISDSQRRRLYLAWLYLLSSLVFLSSGYMLSHYTGEDLSVVLSYGWIFANLPLVAYMANIALSSEVALVCALVAGSAIGGQLAEEKEVKRKASKAVKGGEDILTALKDKELTARELRESLGLSEYQTGNRLKKLAAQGLIAHDDGSPRRYRAAGSEA